MKGDQGLKGERGPTGEKGFKGLKGDNVNTFSKLLLCMSL